MYRIILLIVTLLMPMSAGAQPHADSLAQRVLQAAGGAEAWSKAPYVVFSHAVEIDRIPNRVVRHLWNRMTNQYRMEIPGPAGEPYVLLFDLDTRQGTAYWDTVELTVDEASKRIEEAYERYVNDTFWLLAPMFLFDAGVERRVVPDSSFEEMDILHTRFTLPDRAPASEFYFLVDRSSGLITQWKYRAPLDAPDGPFRVFEWRDYERYPTPGGTLTLSTRKRAFGKPYEVVMKAIRFPSEVPEEWFTEGSPKLTPLTPVQ